MADQWTRTAGALLAAVEAGYEEAGVPLPARRYLSPGRPPADCDQATVHLVRTYSYDGRVTEEVIAPGGDRPSETLALRAAVFVIMVLRKVPIVQTDGSPPPVGGETAAAGLVMADAELLPLLAARADVGCNVLSIGGWTSIAAQGGIAGGELLVIVGV